MGKTQHSKDRMFITATEWREVYGGKKKASSAHREFKQLPFDCCALTFQPFETPAALNGIVYDLLNIVPYLKKHGIDPATGEKATVKDLVRLHFHKNKDGQYHCPVTFKVFSKHTHITAIKTTGNVYSWEAIDQFNIKAKHWHDLLSDAAFKRSDLMDLQDPANPDKNNFAAFFHVHVAPEAEAAAATSQLRGSSMATSSIMAELAATEGDWKRGAVLHSSSDFTQDLHAPKDAAHTAHYSTGEVAASFTSTHLSVKTKNRSAALEDEAVRFAQIKSKGYVRFLTTFGELNLELHCDLVPHTCENFLMHCRSGYYKNTVFHRCIKNFMIQGGDPTGTGKGGESAFPGGAAFKDEFLQQLQHKGRGVLSMANSGPNTNKSQFFITFRSCQHLDRKHTVFGKLVGGLDTLSDMERVKTDDKDRPTEEIRILSIDIYSDPFQAHADAKAAAADKVQAAEAQAEALVEAAPLKAHHGGVGKYIAPGSGSGASAAKRSAAAAATGSSSTAHAVPPQAARASASSEATAPVSAKFQQLATKRAKPQDFGSAW